MQKISCPKCGKQFIWTDDSPPGGKCPTTNCDWHYDVRKEIGKGLARRAEAPSPPAFLCPECGAALSSAWTRCQGCGSLILASRTLKRRHLIFIGILVLAILALSYRYLF